ncbi:MAG: FAD-binding oxidoreductase [Alphaproteobacteria bacterium]|nr:FAD-binding oxidoreductase [Alphaproteobacteria bacterium SS10]
MTDAVDQFVSLLGEASVIAPGDDRFNAYITEWRGKFESSAIAILRPNSTEQVAAAVKCCAANGIAMVPQGGNTSLVGGSVPFKDEQAVVISLDRMAAIRGIDAIDNTITVDAGCILAEIQQAAEEIDRFFPLSLGAEGSCRIGGNIATNAGGILTLRYGNTRDQVLGLEVVTADGQIWDGLNSLRKNNTGYDLKQLFIGSEGTLGIITGACLKLQPRPAHRVTAMVAVPSPTDALAVLNDLNAKTGGQVEAFELMSRPCLELAFKHMDGCRDAFQSPYPWYGLAEITAGVKDDRLNELVEESLGNLIEGETVLDAVLAQNDRERAEFWHLREAIVEAQRLEGGSIKHDIAVPVARIADFIDAGIAKAKAIMPEIRPTVFGHIGDGNLHFNMMQPEAMTRADYLSHWDEIVEPIHALVMAHGGSFSAEHGVGRLKTSDMVKYKSPTELAMMRAVKQALDPKNLMNPGKVIPAQDP